MKKSLLFLFIVHLSTLAAAQLKIPVAQYLDALNKNKYKDVYTDIQRLRVSSHYAKSPTLDYFEAKCLCMNGTKDAAFGIYSKMLQSSQFTALEKDFLYKEFATCGQSTSETAALSSMSAVSKPITILALPATLRGKLGDVTNCYDYQQFIDFSRMPSPDSLANRVFDQKSKAKALRQWKLILSNGYRIDTVSDRFVIVTPASNTNAELSSTIAKLQKAADFYSSYYNLSPPDQLITVFMMPDIVSMQAVSKKIHGIDLPSTNLGYSSLSDLSLVGISDADHVGTIYHELFHLMIRADIGDIPVWLDEGLACLYATSLWQGNLLLGSGITWRTDVLKKATSINDYSLKYPTIRVLTNYTWDEFNGSDNNNICRASINYAIANHLMIYLQEKGLLQQVVSAYRNRIVIDLEKPVPYVNNTATLEKAIGEPVDSLDKHFTSWMAKNYHLNLNFNQRTSSLFTFDEILHSHFFALRNALEQTPHRDSIPSFNKQIDEISTNYEKLASTGEMNTFYKAEENRIHGVYDPFADTEKYRAIKELYDKTLELEYGMRKAIFR